MSSLTTTWPSQQSFLGRTHLGKTGKRNEDLRELCAASRDAESQYRGTHLCGGTDLDGMQSDCCRRKIFD